MADTPSSRRVGASGDVEVSTYLEIAREKAGEAPSTQPPQAPRPARRPSSSSTSARSSRCSSPAASASAASTASSCRTTRPGSTIEKLKPRGVILSGGPASVYEHGAPHAPDLGLREAACPSWASATACSSSPTSSAARSSPSDHREYGHAVDAPGRRRVAALRRAAAVDAGLDVARRPHHAAAARLPVDRPLRQLAVRGDERTARDMFGIQFHPEVVHTPHGKQLIENFLYKVCGCTRRLDARQLHRRRHQPHPQAGRRRQGHLRALRRRRLRRGGDARAQGGRRPAHLHLRRQRADAPRGAGARRRDVPAPHGDQARPRRRRRALPRRSSRASPTPRRSAASSARRSSASSRRRPTSSARSTSSRRARPTRTSSRARPGTARRRRSRRTTTSAGCRRR